jgi:hypothetical protein
VQGNAEGGVILAIDPGSEESAFVEYIEQRGVPHSFGKWRNEDLLNLDIFRFGAQAGGHLAVEMIASYGMPVGREVFETCVFIGRLIQAWGGPYSLVYRKDVKLHLCGSQRAKDSNIRRALIDRFGGDKETKRGGRLYRVSADVWSALAIAVTYSDSVRRAA